MSKIIKQFKRMMNPIIIIVNQIDPDRTLKKLRRRR